MNFSPYDAQQREIDRRAQYAQALMQQGMDAPQGGMAGRIFVGPSWTQGLAQMLKAYGGRKGVEQAENKSVSLANERQQAMVEALKNFGSNPEALLENPDTASLGIGAIQHRDDMTARTAERAEDRAFREQQAAALQAWRASEAERERAFREQQAAADREFRERTLTMQGGGGTPYYQFLPSAEGYMVGNARTGEIAPGAVDGRPVMPGTLDPQLQGELAGAKKDAQLAAERAAAMPQASNARDAALAGLGRIQATVDDMLSNTRGLERSTGIMSHMPTMPGSDSANWQADLETLKAQIGFRGLAEMREASKTGGALGNVTERELGLLHNAYVALLDSQSAEEYTKNLQTLKEMLAGSQEQINQAFAKEYGDMEPARTPNGATGSFGEPAGNLTPEEAAELAELRKRFGR